MLLSIIFIHDILCRWSLTTEHTPPHVIDWLTQTKAKKCSYPITCSHQPASQPSRMIHTLATLLLHKGGSRDYHSLVVEIVCWRLGSQKRGLRNLVKTNVLWLYFMVRFGRYFFYFCDVGLPLYPMILILPG